jgi:hypothetical protein
MPGQQQHARITASNAQQQQQQQQQRVSSEAVTGKAKATARKLDGCPCRPATAVPTEHSGSRRNDSTSL